MIRRKVVTFLTIFFLTAIFGSFSAVFAASLVSVPLQDPLYQILENAQLRDLITPLPSAKPYSKKIIIQSLNQLIRAKDLTDQERTIINSYLENFAQEETWLESGSISTKSDQLVADMGARITSVQGFRLENDLPFSTADFLQCYLEGDMGDDLNHESPDFSYRFDMGFGIYKMDTNYVSGNPRTTTQYTSFAPYSFSEMWDGYSYKLFDVFNYNQGGLNPSYYLGFQMFPELAFEAYDGNLELSFSRYKRNWGPGEDSIVLSESARPFLGLAGQWKIFDWMSYNYLIGGLENSGGSRVESTLQSLISLKMVEMRPFPWLKLGVFEAVVWPKRLEPGYLNPIIFSSLYQGMIGDFDNILGGLEIGFPLGNRLSVYGLWYFDEFRPSSFADLFQRVRNFFSYQAGVKIAVPGVSFSTATVQYTKIEPFMFTHPLTEVPWVEGSSAGAGSDTATAVNESYINDGYGIASKLDPNSDEFLIRFTMLPKAGIQLHFGYSLIRHGHYGGFYDMPLEAYWQTDENDANGILPDNMDDPTDWLGGSVDSVSTLPKAFLRDGNYEWYHIGTLSGQYDMSVTKSIPLAISLSYSLSYQFMNDYAGNRLSDAQVKNTLQPNFETGFKQFLTLGVTVYP